MTKTKPRDSKYYHALGRNIILIVMGVALVPLLLTSGIILERFSTAYQKKVLAHLGELAEKHSQNIDSFLTDRLGDIRVLARSLDFSTVVTTDMGFVIGDEGGALSRKLSLLREEYGGVYVDLGLVSSDGIQVAYAGPYNLMLANYAEAAWFKEAARSEYVISNVFTGLRGSPHFIIATRQSWEGRQWILRATIDFEAFNSLVENLVIGKTGFAFILNIEGKLQTKPRYEVMLHQEPYVTFLSGQNTRSRISISETIDAAGHEAIVAMAPLKGGQWVLCCQQEKDDAFFDLHMAQYLALVVIFISAGIVVVVAVLLTRRLIQRIAQVDEEKQAMNEKVIETGRLASIGELAAGIAHEINNPVAIMVEEAGWIEDLLADEDPSSAETLGEFKRSLAQIRTQGARCKEITHKLLFFARKTDPRITSVGINGLMEDVVGLLKQKSRYASVKIESNLTPGLPPIAASPSEMQQVLLNLVNNAVDAIDAGGGTVTLTTRQDGDAVVVEVADTGQGIPEAILTKIFDPFFTTKPVGQGTGLGLSICYGIVNKLGGEISVDSKIGVGTVFTVRLPIEKSPTDESCSAV
jgi:two-component system NtrC family sensor kinase